MAKTLALLMPSCKSRSDLCAALEPSPRRIHFSSTSTDIVEILEMILSMARNSIEQHQQPIVVIQSNGADLNFPDVGSNTSAAKKIAVLFTLLRTIQATVSTGQVRTIRDVYYSNVELYGDQRKVEGGLSNIANNLRLGSRDSLNILPAQKGLCFSPLEILVQTNGQETLIAANTSSMVPYLAQNSIVHIVTPKDAECKLRVIVLEKEAVYNKLITTDTIQDTIFITGKGYPDFLTRLFLNRLQSNTCILDWRIYTDADPHGVDIALKYMRNDDYEHYMCQKLVYKGVLLTQLIGEREVQFLQMTQRDLSLAIGLISRITNCSSTTLDSRILRTQLQRQLFFQKKAEMNSLSKKEYLN